MKKFLFLLILYLFNCNVGFAENYFFNRCKINEKVYANYSLDLNKKIIEVTLKTEEGEIQKLEDKIQLISEEQITSEIIPSGTGKDNYFQYYLNAKSMSVIKQMYKKEGDFFRLSGPVRQSFCLDVKAGWDKSKIEAKTVSNEKEKILKTTKKISKEKIIVPDCEGKNHKEWTNCQGTFINDDGYKYSGQFKNGKILKGMAIYPGGAKYEGAFKLYIPHGQGTFTFSDGSTHSGGWKEGKGHGQGIKTWKDGRIYAGEFKDDKPHGQGTFTYPDGTEYIGGFLYGKREGEGTLKFPDGKAYIGQFVAGKEYGEGICIESDGTTVDCKVLKNESRVKKTTSNKNIREVLIEAKKWIKVSEYENYSGKGKKIMDNLENNFKAKANELCASKDFNVLEKRINILDLDETPAFGLEPKVKLAIEGMIECK